MTAPTGWDQGTFTPPPCPTCGQPVDIEWIDVRSFASATPDWIPGPVTCPTSRFHNVDTAAQLIALVEVVHPDLGTGWVPLTELDSWRTKGWRPTDPDRQTPAEMVEQRVADLRAGHSPSA